MHKPCPWCQEPDMQAFRNPHKRTRRRLAQLTHLLLLLLATLLLIWERFFEAGSVLFAGFVLMYAMMNGPFFNDFRVCRKCARIEAVPGGIKQDPRG